MVKAIITYRVSYSFSIVCEMITIQTIVASIVRERMHICICINYKKAEGTLSERMKETNKRGEGETEKARRCV